MRRSEKSYIVTILFFLDRDLAKGIFFMTKPTVLVVKLVDPNSKSVCLSPPLQVFLNLYIIWTEITNQTKWNYLNNHKFPLKKTITFQMCETSQIIQCIFDAFVNYMVDYDGFQKHSGLKVCLQIIVLSLQVWSDSSLRPPPPPFVSQTLRASTPNWGAPAVS